MRGRGIIRFTVLSGVAEAAISGKIRVGMTPLHYWESRFRYDTDLWRRNGKSYAIKGNSDFWAFAETVVLNVKCINNCKVIFYFKQMGLFLICQRIWVLRDCAILFSDGGVTPSQGPGKLLLTSVLCLDCNSSLVIARGIP